MTTPKMVLLFAFTAVLPSIADAESKSKAGAVGEARTAIEEANTQFRNAFERGDAKALGALYTPDAIVLPPDSEMVRGRDAIGEFWKNTRSNGIKSAALETIDVGRSGDVAYEVGTVALTIQPEGKEATTSTAKYLVVWKRQADGSWKLHRDIWNSLPPKK